MSHVYADPNTGCWLWDGRPNKQGYGTFYVDRQRGEIGSHRFAYEHFKCEAIPPGYEIDHTCFFPPCVNPRHLEAITKEENAKRARKLGLKLGPAGNGRRQRAKTHCPQGHEYPPDCFDKRGYRVCKPCHLDSGKRRYWRDKDQSPAMEA